MRKPARLAVALALCQACSLALAQDEDGRGLAAPYEPKCSAGTMLEMNTCLERELADVEQRLKSEYQHLLDSLADPDPLIRAQTVWLAFRHRDCEFALPGSHRAGSTYPYARMACQIDVDERRIRDLRRYSASDAEG